MPSSLIENGFDRDELIAWFSDMPSLSGIYTKINLTVDDCSPIPFASILEQTLFSGNRHWIFRFHVNVENLVALWGNSPGVIGDSSDFFMEIGNRLGNQWREHYIKSYCNEDSKISIGSLPRLLSHSGKYGVSENFQLGASYKIQLESDFSSCIGRIEWIYSPENFEDEETEKSTSLLNLPSHILDHFPLGVVIVDNNFRVKSWNSWMRNHAVGFLARGSSYLSDDSILFARSCLLEGEEACTQLHSAVSNAINIKQSSYFSHSLHRSILSLHSENGNRMYQNISVTPIPNGAMIQITDMSSFAEKEILLKSQIEWLDKNLEKSSQSNVSLNKNKFDDLTNLPDRSSWSRIFRKELDSVLDHETVTLVCFGIDRLKSMNDSLGHFVGDRVIEEIGTRLKVSYPKAIIGRWNGDSFFLFFKKSLDFEISSILTQNVQIGMDEIVVSFSVGAWNFSPSYCSDSQRSVQIVEWCYEESKKKGRNYIYRYKGEHVSDSSNVFRIEAGLKSALQKEQFELVYQPQISLLDKTLCGAEVLLRWNHHDLGPINPDVFIPVAEDSGAILYITRWILDSVLVQIKKWLDTYGKSPKIAINLSVVQFHDDDFIETLRFLLKKYNIDSKYLSFEITESLLLTQNNANFDFLNKLKEIGVSISIDDFGSGYSSLSYLNHLPVNKIKLDKSFLINPQDGVLIHSIVQLAHNLNLKVISEGVERKEHEILLNESNCDYAQGFYYSRPLQSSVFEDIYVSKIK